MDFFVVHSFAIAVVVVVVIAVAVDPLHSIVANLKRDTVKHLIVVKQLSK